MTKSNSTISLQSDKAGKTLISLLFINIYLSLPNLIVDIVTLIKSTLPKSLEYAGIVFSSALIIISVIIAVYFFIWLYRLHIDLNRIFPNYPVKRKEAFKRTAVPLYNVWSLWHIFDELYKFFKGEEGLSIYTREIKKYFTWLFISLAIIAFVSPLIFGGHNGGQYSVGRLIFTTIDQIVNAYFVIKIIYSIRQALYTKSEAY